MLDFFSTPWTVAVWTPLSIDFSRQESWSALPSPSPGDLPNPGIEPVALLCLLCGRLILYHGVAGESPLGPLSSHTFCQSFFPLPLLSECQVRTTLENLHLALLEQLSSVPRRLFPPGPTDVLPQLPPGRGRIPASWEASAFPSPGPCGTPRLLTCFYSLSPYDIYCVTCFIFTLSLNLVIIVKLDSIIKGPFKWWKSGGHLPKMRSHLPKIIQVIGTKPRSKPSSGLFQRLGPLTYSVCCQLCQIVSKISSEKRVSLWKLFSHYCIHHTCFSVWSRPSLSVSVASFVNLDSIFLMCAVFFKRKHINCLTYYPGKLDL